MDVIDEAQARVCERYGIGPYPTPAALKVGIASNVRDGAQPLNGLRCHPVGDTSGWYIWAGEEWSDDPDFFVPLHIHHLAEVTRRHPLPVAAAGLEVPHRSRASGRLVRRELLGRS